MIGGQEEGVVALLEAAAVETHLGRSEIGELLDIQESLYPAPGGAVPDRILARQAELSLQELTASGGVDQPRALNFVTGKRDAVRAFFGQVRFESFGAA